MIHHLYLDLWICHRNAKGGACQRKGCEICMLLEDAKEMTEPGLVVMFFYNLKRKYWNVRWEIKRLFHDHILWRFVDENKWCCVCYRWHTEEDGKDGRPDCPSCDQS